MWLMFSADFRDALLQGCERKVDDLRWRWRPRPELHALVMFYNSMVHANHIGADDNGDTYFMVFIDPRVAVGVLDQDLRALSSGASGCILEYLADGTGFEEECRCLRVVLNALAGRPLRRTPRLFSAHRETRKPIVIFDDALRGAALDED